MGKKSVHSLPEYVHTGKSRHGRIYYYFQRHRGTKKAGPYVRLPDDPTSPAFWSAYQAASGEHVIANDAGTFSALIREYKKSRKYTSKAVNTRTEYDRYLTRIEAKWGHLQVRALRPAHVLAMHDGMQATPVAADAQVSCLSNLIKWGIPRGYRDDNPAEAIERNGQEGDGYAPWPDWALALVGENARPDLARASCLARFLGQRKSDVIRITRADRIVVRIDGVPRHVVKVTQQKTGDAYLIPMHRDLIALWDQWLADGMDLLVVLQPNGVPFTPDTFGAAWGREMKKDWAAPIRAAGLTFHGHRKSAAKALAEAGVSDQEGGRMIGMSPGMFRHYAKGADQLRMAVGALQKLEKSGPD